MIKSPYDALGARNIETDPERTLEGEFWCTQCIMVNDEAQYAPDKKLLFWNCENGHFNEVEDFEVDE